MARPSGRLVQKLLSVKARSSDNSRPTLYSASGMPAVSGPDEILKCVGYEI